MDKEKFEDWKKMATTNIKIFCKVTKRYIDSRACTDCQYRKSIGCPQYDKMQDLVKEGL